MRRHRHDVRFEGGKTATLARQVLAWRLSEGDSSRRRKTTVGWAVALAVVMTLATTGTAMASHWQYYELSDGDSYYDAATRDSDGNGWVNEYYMDIDRDPYFDTYTYNTLDSDVFHEVREFDMDENGQIEFRLLDGDQLEGFDYVYADANQNGVWDRPRKRFRGDTVRQKPRLVIPGSNIDADRTNRQNISRDMMHRFTMATGQSLLYPTVAAPYASRAAGPS